MVLSVARTEQFVVNMDRRMTFHFGNVSVAEGPQIILDLSLSIDGTEQQGVSMGTMTPMWFLKNPALSMEDGIDALLEVLERACEHARHVDGARTVFDLWWAVYRRQDEWGADTDHPPLLYNYGVSLVEQAIIDAYCRATDRTFGDAVRNGDLGLTLGTIYDELEGESAADLLPDEPARSTAVRHTIGLTDPLTAADLDDDERVDDGLPQTFEEYIRENSVNHFKIKLSADRERDRKRLVEIASVIADCGLDEYAFTLDANEQYESVRTFRDQWEGLADDPALDEFIDHLLYVEQPLDRNDAFSEATREILASWNDSPPVIIDESDDRIDSLGTALASGYNGTSHKNCKGVFKGIANRCLIEFRRLEDSEGEYLISGEDLTTLGPVELQSDLAVMATIGMDHVERNGHHYYRGLADFPAAIQEDVLEAHGDLYTRHEDGFTTLDIDDGRIRFDTVVDAPFGYALDFDPSQFTSADDWAVTSIYE